MSGASRKFFELNDNDLRLFLRVSPGSAKNELTGIWTGADGEQRLSIKVTAVPDKGKANAAIVKLLGKQFRLPKTAFSITSGETSRLKTISVSGDPQRLVELVKTLTGELE